MDMRGSKDLSELFVDGGEDLEDLKEGMTASQLQDFIDCPKDNYRTAEMTCGISESQRDSPASCGFTVPGSKIYEQGVQPENSENSENSEDSQGTQVANIDEIDASTDLRTSVDSCMAVNVHHDKGDKTSVNTVRSMYAQDSCHRDSEDLMTVSQLHEAGSNQDTSQETNREIIHGLSEVTGESIQSKSDRNSINFDGLTISQIFDANASQETSHDETAELLNRPICDGKCGQDDNIHEEADCSRSDGHGDYLCSNGNHSNSACLATGGDGCHGEEAGTHVSGDVEQPEGICTFDINSLNKSKECKKDERNYDHGCDDHDGVGEVQSLSAMCGSEESHADAGGEYIRSQDVSAFRCTSDSSDLVTETQVESGLSGIASNHTTSTADMLCVSANPQSCALVTFRTQSVQSDCVQGVGDLNAFFIKDKTESQLSHQFTNASKNAESINCEHNDIDAYSIGSEVATEAYEHVESQATHDYHSHGDIGIAANISERSQDNKDLITTTYQQHLPELVSGDFEVNSQVSLSEFGLNVAKDTPPTVIEATEPQNRQYDGISGPCAITDQNDLPKDFDGVGFSTLSRSKKSNHAKFLRLYDLIDLDDKTSTAENVTLNAENNTDQATTSTTSNCKETFENKDQSETSPAFSNSEDYGTIKRNGSASPGVRLRRQKSSPDPGRKGLTGSPLMRVKGIIVDDASSIDSDSPRCSEDSEDEDEDAGIYADSYRMSRWLYLGESDLSVLSDIGNARISRSGSSSPSVAGTTSSGTCDSLSDLMDDGQDLVPLESQEGHLKDVSGSQEFFSQGEPKRKNHRRSESISTTASEVEFRLKYKTKTRRVVQRKSSMQLYQRISEKYLDEGRIVTVEKLDEDASFGFHIKDSQPVIVSTIEEGSPAQRGGLQVGDVLIAVNEVNVLEASHQEVVKLMAADTDRVKLRVVADRLPADAPLCCGYLTKQGGSGILKNWRRRWFVLKQDHCLYYYKSDEDKDPLGAILLSNYTITKAPEINRKYVFKASKYGQRTYYFQADSEEDMTGWASAMATAADVSNKQDTWLDVSSHNVGLPALAIKQPDCHGHLTKMGNRHKSWKRRYCVLKDACLYYYMDVSSSTAQGVAHLHGYTVDDNLPFNKKFGFMVIPPDKNLRTFYFSADNETDKKRWMEALQKSISRWVRADEA